MTAPDPRDTEQARRWDDNPCAQALEDLWKHVILSRKPGYGDWEYPGQAFRHLKAEFDAARADGARDERERCAKLAVERCHEYMRAYRAAPDDEPLEKQCLAEKAAGANSVAVALRSLAPPAHQSGPHSEEASGSGRSGVPQSRLERSASPQPEHPAGIAGIPGSAAGRTLAPPASAEEPKSAPNEKPEVNVAVGSGTASAPDAQPTPRAASPAERAEMVAEAERVFVTTHQYDRLGIHGATTNIMVDYMLAQTAELRLALAETEQTLDVREDQLDEALARAGQAESQLAPVRAELERVQAKADASIQQAQGWSLEARTQRSIVLEILRDLGLPEHDWEATILVRDHVAALSLARPSGRLCSWVSGNGERCELAAGHDTHSVTRAVPSLEDDIATPLAAAPKAETDDRILVRESGGHGIGMAAAPEPARPRCRERAGALACIEQYGHTGPHTLRPLGHPPEPARDVDEFDALGDKLAELQSVQDEIALLRATFGPRLEAAKAMERVLSHIRENLVQPSFSPQGCVDLIDDALAASRKARQETPHE